MDTAASMYTFCFLLAICISCSSGSLHILVKDFKQNELEMKDEHTLHVSQKGLVGNIRHDFDNPYATPYPTIPITNPVTAPPITNPVTTPAAVTVPPDTSSPATVNIPSVNPVPITNPVNPSVTPYPTTPLTNPVTATPITNPVTTPAAAVTVPPDTSSPATVTIPSVNPVPITNPVNPTMPITNPVTTPSTTYNPGGQPVTNINPGTTYPNPTVPATTPVVAQPVTTTNAPVIPGQSWCVARSGVAETDVQAALDYACGIGGADCAAIQQGGSCYNPNNMQNHASYAFNSYYQRNPVQTSCDFGGTAFITNMNPSSGSCIYHTWSSSSALPNSVSPITTNPTTSPTTPSSSGATPVSSGTPPVIFPTGTPALGGATTGYGEMPPMANTSSTSMSNGLQPFIGCVSMMTSLITWKLVLDL